MQFMNKVLYAREGAKGIIDRTFADFPWEIRVEVDGVDIEVPEVSLLIENILQLWLQLFNRFSLFIHSKVYG